MIVFMGIATLLVMLFWYNQFKFWQFEKKYPPAGQFVTVEGVKLHYISKGTGQPVVFLHGGVLSANDFAEVMDLAAAEGYQAIAFDRPGYGYSERPADEDVTPKTQARLLHQALHALEVEKPILVGHSWSGLLVLTYALEYPEQISGVVTLGGGMYPEGYPAEKGDPISTLVTTPIVGDAVMNLLLGVVGPVMADRTLDETFKPEQASEAYRLATHSYWLRPSQFKANREDVLAFVPAAKEMMDQYHTIKQPLAIVVGVNDPFETKQHSYRLHKEVPDSTLIELENAAHMLPQLHPQAVLQAIEALVLKEPSER